MYVEIHPDFSEKRRGKYVTYHSLERGLSGQ